jgi:ribosome maturation factor RimP
MDTVDSVLCTIIRSELRCVGCELVDLEVTRVRGRTTVKVYTDKRGGITLETIETAAGKIRDGFDRADLLGTDYRLEVSSPGEKRSLRGEKSLGDLRGRCVMVYLKDGRKRTGTVVEADLGFLTVQDEKGEGMRIGRDLIEDMHLLYSCTE